MAKNMGEEKIKRIALDISDYKMLKAMCTEHNTSIKNLIHSIALYPTIAEIAFQLPKDISADTVCAVDTVDAFAQLWVENIRDNLEMIKTGKDVKDIPQKEEPALVIGAGPSLIRKKHLELLAKKGFNGTIFVTDSILKRCLEHDIVPDYVLTIDGSEKVLSHINHDIIDDHANEIGAIMSTVTHPSVVKRWKGKIFWYEVAIPEIILPNFTRITNILCGKTQFYTSGHVASVGWNVSYEKKHNPIISIGIDLGNPMDVPISEAWNFSTKMEVLNDEEKVKEYYKNYYHHTVFNTDCYYDTATLAFINSSRNQLKLMAKHGTRIINCTEGGTLEGEGIECMRFDDYLKSQKQEG